MRKKELVDIVFLLDRSGSMAGIEEDTIGGYNSYLEKEKGKNVRVTTVLFDDQYEVLNNMVSIDEVKNLTKNEYYVRGCTALYDAIGKTLLGSLNYFFCIKPEILFRRAEIGFPVVVADSFYTISEIVLGIHAEQIIVVVVNPCTGQDRQGDSRQKANDDKSLHRFWVYIC